MCLTLASNNYPLKKKLIIATSLLILFAAAKCSVNGDSMSYLNEKAEEIFGDDYSMQFNSDSTYVLVKNLLPANSPFYRNLHYIVYEIKTRKEIINETLINADVKWAKLYKLYIAKFPGIVSERDENKIHSYLYDVKNKTKKNL